MSYLVGFTGSSVVVVATAKSSREKDQRLRIVCGTLAISRVWNLRQSEEGSGSTWSFCLLVPQVLILAILTLTAVILHITLELIFNAIIHNSNALSTRLC